MPGQDLSRDCYVICHVPGQDLSRVWSGFVTCLVRICHVSSQDLSRVWSGFVTCLVRICHVPGQDLSRDCFVICHVTHVHVLEVILA